MSLTDGMPPESAGMEARGAWLIGALMKQFPDLKDYQAAGLVGNLAYESAGIKAIQERGQTPPNGGFGWAQWTGSRRRDFEAYCQANNLAQTSDEANYGMLLSELQGSESAAFSALLGSVSLADATKVVCDKYERPGDPVGTLPARTDDAQKALAAYVAQQSAPAPQPPVPVPVPPAPPAGDAIAAAIALIDARIAKLQAAREVLASIQGDV